MPIAAGQHHPSAANDQRGPVRDRLRGH
jgi:hypothetical protein